MTTSLIAPVSDSTTAVTGLGLVEDAELIVSGIRDQSWVDGTLGAVGASLDTLALAIDPIGTLGAWGVAWLMEHVRPLQDALDWLAGDVDQIAAHAATWANVAAFTAAAGAEFAERLRVEVAGWSGASAETYRAHAGEHLNVLQGVSTAAGGISFAVEGAGLLVGLVRGIVRDLIAQFIATLAVRLPQWLAMEGLTLGIATPLVATQVSALVTRTVKEIQHFVRALLNSLRRLLPKIDSLEAVLDRLRMLSDRLGHSGPTGSPAFPATGAQPSKVPPRHGGNGKPDNPGFGPTTPSSPPDPARKPRGKRTDAHPTKVDDRGVRRENEAADVLAQHGYDVEQNPPGNLKGTNPDYKVEGGYFECYSPETTNIDKIRNKMSEKAADQADHLVINLADTPCTMEEITDVLERKPIRHLKEVFFVKDNQVFPLQIFGR